MRKLQQEKTKFITDLSNILLTRSLLNLVKDMPLREEKDIPAFVVRVESVLQTNNLVMLNNWGYAVILMMGAWTTIISMIAINWGFFPENRSLPNTIAKMTGVMVSVFFGECYRRYRQLTWTRLKKIDEMLAALISQSPTSTQETRNMRAAYFLQQIVQHIDSDFRNHLSDVPLLEAENKAQEELPVIKTKMARKSQTVLGTQVLFAGLSAHWLYLTISNIEATERVSSMDAPSLLICALFCYVLCYGFQNIMYDASPALEWKLSRLNILPSAEQKVSTDFKVPEMIIRQKRRLRPDSYFIDFSRGATKIFNTVLAMPGYGWKMVSDALLMAQETMRSSSKVKAAPATAPKPMSKSSHLQPVAVSKPTSVSSKKNNKRPPRKPVSSSTDQQSEHSQTLTQTSTPALAPIPEESFSESGAAEAKSEITLPPVHDDLSATPPLEITVDVPRFFGDIFSFKLAMDGGKYRDDKTLTRLQDMKLMPRAALDAMANGYMSIWNAAKYEGLIKNPNSDQSFGIMVNIPPLPSEIFSPRLTVSGGTDSDRTDLEKRIKTGGLSDTEALEVLSNSYMSLWETAKDKGLVKENVEVTPKSPALNQ